MRNWSLATGLVLVWGSAPASGYIANPPPIRPLYQRVAWSDLIVVGTVTEIEEKPARDEDLPGQPKGWHTRVVRVEVAEVLLGPAQAKSVRLAVNPMWMKPPASWSDPDRLFGRGPVPKELPKVQPLEKGRRGAFFLSRRPPGEVYVPTLHPAFTDQADPMYEEEVKRCRRLLRLLADPKGSLRAEATADRRASAAMLLWRYAVPRYEPLKTEPIDAEESKLILGVLADSEWAAPKVPDEEAPPVLYGWVYPALGAGSDAPARARSAGDYEPIREWLRASRDKYRIRRYVWDAK